MLLDQLRQFNVDSLLNRNHKENTFNFNPSKDDRIRVRGAAFLYIDIERTADKCYTKSCLNSGVWRSLEARLVWDQEVGSSNLPTPTTL